MVTDTIYVPTNIRITGEMWPMIMFEGSKFQDMSNPIPGFRVGLPGEVGKVEFSDILFETTGPTPGLIMMEWNLEQEAPAAAGTRVSVHLAKKKNKANRLLLKDCGIHTGVLAEPWARGCSQIIAQKRQK